MFEIGNRVYCLDKKIKKTVKSINKSITDTYPVSVSFDNGVEDTYTKTGKRLDSGNKVLCKIDEQAAVTRPDLEIVPDLGQIYTLSCGTRILKTIENTHIILPQIPDL